jgi:hypothetical protein
MESQISTVMFGASLLASVMAGINILRRDRLFLGLAFMALAATCTGFGFTQQDRVVWIGGGAVVILLVVDIFMRSGPPKR